MTYAKLGEEVGQLVDAKAASYGHSVATSADCLRLLYPDGIKPDQYDEALCAARIFEKLARRANGRAAFGESEYIDIAGHALLALGDDDTGEQ